MTTEEVAALVERAQTLAASARAIRGVVEQMATLLASRMLACLPCPTLPDAPRPRYAPSTQDTTSAALRRNSRGASDRGICSSSRSGINKQRRGGLRAG